MLTTNGHTTRIHLAEKDYRQPAAATAIVSDGGFESQFVVSRPETLERLKAANADAIVTDLVLPVSDGFELLRHLKQRGALTAAIVLTGFGSTENALAFIHDLQTWLPEQPAGPRGLPVLMKEIISKKRVPGDTGRPEAAANAPAGLGALVGKSRAMQEVFSVMRQAGPSSAPILICGESGTGKELVAREIHRLSPRREGPFVAINSAAVPESLIESELFGHEKGAFTGASERRAGCFEQAHGGTLLLDEIGEMPRAMQPRLLRVLEDLRVRRLGGKCEIKVDTRVIASTNRCPETHLREDLYYRLNVFQIVLPPLRERKEDLPLLAEAMIEDVNKKHGISVTGLDREVMDVFDAYDWPGNAREMRNVIERASIVAGSGNLRMQHLPSPAFKVSYGQGSAEVCASEGSLVLQPGQSLAQAEAAYIRLTMEHVDHNRRRAANLLGISIRTLQNRVKLLRKEGKPALVSA